MAQENRGFEVTDERAQLPKRATERSAAYDISVLENVIVPAHGQLIVDTGLCAYMKKNEVLKIYIRSSLGRKGLELSNKVGIIDSDYYPNQIKLLLRNYTRDNISLKAGDRVAQAIFQEYLIADNDDSDQERVGGFGSTGR